MIGSAKSDEVEQLDPEFERVCEWRLQQFLDIGVELVDAENLAPRLEVSHHEMKTLIRRGATVDQAVRILA